MNPERIYREHRDEALAMQFTAQEYATFVAMPFKDSDTYSSKRVYNDLICAASEEANGRLKTKRLFSQPHRVDQAPSVAHVITETIFLKILESHFVLVDLTCCNAGALLEAGAALALKPNKQIILIHCGEYSNLHFDIRQNSVIKYEQDNYASATSLLALAMESAADSFECDINKYVNFIKHSLTAEAVALLRFYKTLWKDRDSGSRPSLHMESFVKSPSNRDRSEIVSTIIFMQGSKELIDKRLMITEYNPNVYKDVDLFGMQATALGKVVIKEMWGFDIPLDLEVVSKPEVP